MRTKQAIALMVFLLVMMAGCAPAARPQPEVNIESVVISGNIRLGVNRIVDKEAGVACWVYRGIEKGAISCLPISQTQLDP